MRHALLSSVSFVFLALVAPVTAQAGFEFVPPAAAVAPAAKAPVATVPAVDNAPVTTEILEPTPYVDEKATIPAAPMAPAHNAPVADVPVASEEPKADEPMILGRKAVPLTPVVKESDALMFDDVPLAPLPSPAATPQKTRTPLASTSNHSDVLWDNQPSAAPVTHASSDLPPALPPMDITMDAPPELAAPRIAASDLEDGLPVQGFGRQVPLAMALQQIVPPNYRYSFDTGVDPGQRVSWTGGKSWKAIIMELARNNNLNVDIVTNVVAFHRRTPMDIVASSSDVDTSTDTVQGMTLKSVDGDNTVILPPIDSTIEAPRTVIEKRQATEVKAAKEKKIKRATFDSMLDTDTPAQSAVKEKRILIGEDDPVENEQPAAAKNVEKTIAIAPEVKAEYKPAAAPVAEKTIDFADDNSAAQASLDAAKADAGFTDPSTPMNIVPASGNATDLPPIMPNPIVSSSVTSEALPAKDEWMKPLPTDEIAAAPATASAASASVPADLTTSREWEGYKNQTLRETLTSWSQTAGVSVVWSSEFDYPLQTDVRVEANYGDAVRTLLAGFSKAQPRPIGRLFKNDKVGAQPVLVVETQRLTN